MAFVSPRCVERYSTRRATWVDFPDRSRPSITMNAPRGVELEPESSGKGFALAPVMVRCVDGGYRGLWVGWLRRGKRVERKVTRRVNQAREARRLSAERNRVENRTPSFSHNKRSEEKRGKRLATQENRDTMYRTRQAIHPH